MYRKNNNSKSGSTRWKYVKLEDICEIKGRVGWKGYTKKDLVTSGPLALGATHINSNNRLDLSEPVYLSREKYEESPEIMVNKGDILIVQRGSLGKVVLVDREIGDATINPSMVLLKNISINNEYLYYFLCSEYIQRKILLEKSQTSIPMISQEQIRKFNIYLPNLEEQEKISEILSTWDLAIEKQEQLIEKKKEFKKGLIQRLLTGEVRFKEFNDKWKTLMIKDIADPISELNKSDEKLTVLSCTKYDGLVESLKYFGKQMFSDDTSKYKKVWKNDFAYATNHIEEGSIGVQRICDVGLVSPMYTVFRINDEIVDTDYLFYLLKTERYISIYKSRMSASVDRRGSLRWPEFSKIKLMLPSIHEQKKITEVLKSSDKEIELLEKELEALKLQKKGLMQRLLTGEVRVKV